MAASIGNLALQLTASTAGLASGLAAATNMVGSFAANAGKALAGFGGNLFGKLARGDLLGLAGMVPQANSLITALEPLAGPMLRSAAAAETARLRFATMFDSTEKATAALGQLKALSLASGLGMDQLEPGARNLAQAGLNADYLVATMRSLASVSAVTGFSIDEMSGHLAKMVATGHVSAKELNAFGGETLQKLADNLGVPKAALHDMVKSGQVGVKDLLTALGQVTSEGGKYANALSDRAKTMAGMWDIAGLQIKSVAGAIGKSLMGGLARGFAGDDPLAALTSTTDRIKAAIADLEPAFEKIGQGLSLVWNFSRMAASGLGQVWDISVGWIGDFVNRNSELLTSLAYGAAALGALYVGVQVAAAGYGLLVGVMGFFKVAQIASAALWVGQIAVIGAAKLVMLLFNAQLLLFSGAVGISTGVTTLWSGAVLIAKATTWLWNTALAAMNVLLSAPVILAAVGTVALLTAGIGFAAGAVGSLVAGITTLGGAFRGLSFANSPLGHIGSLFGQWKGLIGDIVGAMKTDMPGAMKLATAAFELAFYQVRDLLPPLWEYLKGGFLLVWTFIGEQLEIALDRGVLKATKALLDSPLSPFWGKEIEGGRADRARKAQEADLTAREKGAADRLTAGLQGLKFNAPMMIAEKHEKERKAGEIPEDVKAGRIPKDTWWAYVGVQLAKQQIADAANARLFDEGIKNFTDRAFGSGPAINLGNAVPDGGFARDRYKLASADFQGSKEAESAVNLYKLQQQIGPQQDVAVDQRNQLIQGIKNNDEKLQRIETVLRRLGFPVTVSL